MVFAEFYTRNLAGKLDHAVGDRSIIILDGRCNPSTWHSIASHECASRNFEAYVIRKGRGFTDSKALTGLVFPSQCGAPQA